MYVYVKEFWDTSHSIQNWTYLCTLAFGKIYDNAPEMSEHFKQNQNTRIME